MKYPHVASLVFNTPLLIHPLKLDAILGGLGSRLLGAPLVIAAAPAIADTGAVKPEMFSTRRGERSDRGYRIVDGVAVLGINGALVHRSQFDMADSSFLLGYNDISADLEDAMTQPNSDVHAVLQVYDTPGGEVAGAFENAQRTADFRSKKPMYAIADNMAASAGYLAAAAADKVYVSSTGYLGSIGVVMRHVDFSKLLASEGITVTQLFEGAHKTDGNPYEALPESVRADFQAEMKKLYGMFTGAVAQYRGIEDQAVRATQARTYLGAAAVDAGLATGVSTTDALITELSAQRARIYPAGSARSSTATPKGNSMSGTSPAADAQQPATQPAAQPAALTQADLDKSVATAVTTAIAAERTRSSAIMAHKEAEGRTALAAQCVATGLTVEAAGLLLAAAPKAAAPNGFAAAMTGMGNPKVDGVEGAAAEADDPRVVAASWDKAFGVKAAAQPAQRH